MGVAALGQYQPVSLSPGERLVPRVKQPFDPENSAIGKLSVCFHQKRSLGVGAVTGCFRPEAAVNRDLQAGQNLDFYRSQRNATE